MGRRLRYGLLAGCLGLIALHAEPATAAWDGGAPSYASSPGPGTPGDRPEGILAREDEPDLDLAVAGR